MVKFAVKPFTDCSMADKATAPGHTTRQANKQLRRQKILKVAKDDFPEIKFYTTSDFKVDALAHVY